MDDLANNSNGTRITDEELNMLEERWEEYKNNPLRMKTWEEVKQDIYKKLDRKD